MNDRALKAFEAAVRADKNNAQYLNNYGFLLLQTSNFESAVKHLKRAAKLSPNDARIWNNLAIAQCQREKFDEAYQSFVRAVGEYDGRVNMAAQLLRTGSRPGSNQTSGSCSFVAARVNRSFDPTCRALQNDRQNFGRSNCSQVLAGVANICGSAEVIAFAQRRNS